MGQLKYKRFYRSFQ